MTKCFCDKECIPFNENGKEIIEKYDGIRSRLLKCPTCDYYTYDNIPTDVSLNKYYTKQYAITPNGWYSIDGQYSEGHWNTISSNITKLLPVGAKIHDIGCAFGGLVSKLRELGFEATGTDLNEPAITQGRTINEFIYNEDAFEFMDTNGKQDAILLHHCLEHIPNVEDFLTKTKEYLVDDGLLFIWVPNGNSIFTQKSIKFHWYSFPDHLHYFCPASFVSLADKLKIELLESQCTTRLAIGSPKAEFIEETMQKMLLKDPFNIEINITENELERLHNSLIPCHEEYSSNFGKYLAKLNLTSELQTIFRNTLNN